MRAGRLSYSQVRAISRVPRPGEFRVVEDLIEVARHGTAAQLEVMVRGLRTVDDNECGLDRVEREYVTQGWTAESLWRVSARLDPERGAVVKAALERVAASEQLSPTDALVRLAEIALAALADADNPPRSLRGDERAAVVIHLDASRLAAISQPATREPATGEPAAREPATGEPAAGQPAICGPETGVVAKERSAEPGGEPRRDPVPSEATLAGAVLAGAASGRAGRSAKPRRVCARIDDGPGLPDGVVERLLCSGRIRTIVHDATGNVLDVGRSHRLVTDRQYRALMLRHGGHCGHPGCPNTKNLHAHHVLFWYLGGLTDMANLVLLCERHHVGLHDGEFRIVALGGGRFRFERRGVDLAQPRPNTVNGFDDGDVGGETVDAAGGEGGVENADGADNGDVSDDTIAPDAATPRWDGQRLDRDYAISVLASRRYASVDG